MHQLTTYQSEIARAVLDSVLNERGLTFTVEIARGGGVRELSAQIEHLLLTLHLNDGANLLRIAPPGSADTRERVVEALQEGAPEGLWAAERKSVRLGRSTLRFLTTDELGPAILHHGLGLIEVADAQMVSEQVFESWIRPLGDIAGATTVLYGQPLNGETPFELTKQRNREAEVRDGITRHFRVASDEVALALPEFAREMAEERARLGSEHPEFQSAYLLRPTIGGAPLLATDHLNTIESGCRTHEPNGSSDIVASVIATRLPDAERVSVAQLFASPTATAVVTIATRTPDSDLHVIEHRWVEAVTPEMLAKRVAKILAEWQPVRTVAEDGTSQRTGLHDRHANAFRDALTQAMGFTPIAWVRSDTASDSRRLTDLLAALHTGRLTTYRFDGSPEHRALRHELATAEIEYTDGLLTTSVPAGEEGFLRGLMLIVRTTAAVQRPTEIAMVTKETALAS
ncbi:MAG: hypothetical protein O2884_14965 [Chloroflexi bacterium]|nr:hypothetical protein [Chloroflexota bacterium]